MVTHGHQSPQGADEQNIMVTHGHQNPQGAGGRKIMVHGHQTPQGANCLRFAAPAEAAWSLRGLES